MTAPAETSRRVIKIGGSLFDDARLPEALGAFLSAQPPAPTILLAGGGPWAEALREADRTFKLGESAAHRLCFDAMSVTARLLATLTEAPLIDRLEEITGVSFEELDRQYAAYMAAWNRK